MNAQKGETLNNKECPGLGINKATAERTIIVFVSVLLAYTTSSWWLTQNPGHSISFGDIMIDNPYVAALLAVPFGSAMIIFSAYLGSAYMRHCTNNGVIEPALLSIEPGSVAHRYLLILVRFVIIVVVISQLHFINKMLDGYAYIAQDNSPASIFKYIPPSEIIGSLISGKEPLKYGDSNNVATYYGLIQLIFYFFIQAYMIYRVAGLYCDAFVLARNRLTRHAIISLSVFAYICMVAWFVVTRNNPELNTLL